MGSFHQELNQDFFRNTTLFKAIAYIWHWSIPNNYAVRRIINYVVRRIINYAVRRIINYAVRRIINYAVRRINNYAVNRISTCDEYKEKWRQINCIRCNTEFLMKGLNFSKDSSLNADQIQVHGLKFRQVWPETVCNTIVTFSHSSAERETHACLDT